jgi:DNA-binding winged helix-turn-helix (wHTH) protein/tetratricopeptide (TPR) repeat protein
VDNPDEEASRRLARFGPYEADFQAGELRKHGLRVKIQEKPMRLLQALVERPGQIVTREELRARVWPSGVFIEFDASLKIALNKLRRALCDSPDSPRYIETLPRRGYRFIAQVEAIEPNGDGAPSGATADGSRHDGENGAAPRVASQNGSAEIGASLVPQGPFSSPPVIQGDAGTLPPANEKPDRPASYIVLPPRGRAAGWTWATGAALLVLIALGAVILHDRWFANRPAMAFHRRDWVLVSRFENSTGERVLDGTVDFAVARELSNSQFVGVVPPERVGDDLRLMEKPPDTPLDRKIAREICLRDGGIRALITGRVEKIGSDYVLDAGIVDPATGAQVAGLAAKAADLNGILPAVRQLSNQLRAALGETLPDIHESNLKLEKATTPSLRALQLYSQADAIAIEQGPLEKPIPLLEQALADDPNFASAHILLAWCYSNIGKQAQAAPHFQRAFELASTVSERERLFILGSYYERFKHDHEKAIQEYEALVRLYPDDFWGTNNLAYEYSLARPTKEGAEMAARSANLRPANFRVNVMTWQGLSASGYEAEARPFFLRARRLLTPEVEKEDPSDACALRAGIAEDDLKAGKIEAALGLTQKLAAMPAADVVDVDRLYLKLGKLKLAQEWMQRLPGSPYARWQPALAADLASQRGDLAGERRILGRRLTETVLHDGVLAAKFVHCGMLRQAERQVTRYDKWYARQKVPPYEPPEWGEGSLALARGHNAEAIRLLTEYLQKRPYVNYALMGISPMDDLATAYEREGRIADAIRTLQTWEARTLLDFPAILHLYKLYLKAGDARDAQQVRADLLHRLAYADPDYPVLLQLKKQENLDASLHAGR